ncbi:MAG: anthranilate phosphoribosyltransferase [Candidatus Dormibacteraceae bacterium]
MVGYLEKLIRGESLDEAEAATAMEMMLRGEATPSQIAGFLIALRAKGEQIAEITGFARTALAMSTPVQIPGLLLDVVGTGGDGLATFNISTLSSVVSAACGARVAKHGNRAQSSISGSADVLEALGVRIDLGPEGVARCINEVGIGFMYAQRYHPAFRYAGPTRRELGIRTVFNILGPICNPARAGMRAIGVADQELVEPVVQVLQRLEVPRVLVFHGAGGMDELSTTGPSIVVEVLDGRHRRYPLDPADLDLKPASARDVQGGSPQRNAGIARRILAGERGPQRDIVLLNTAAALRAAGIAADWQEGIGLGAEAIDDGRAGALLERWATVSQEAASA